MMFFISTILILLLAAGPLSAQDRETTPVFKAGAVDVRMDVQVIQGKTVLKGFTKDDFAITDEGAPQNIAYFGHDAEPVNLLLLLDISGSMQKYIEQISATARDAMKYLRPGDRVAIMVFGKTSEIHQEFSDNLAESARQIASAVENHDVGAGTLINAAVVHAAQYMNEHAPGGRRAILILTDNLSLSYQLTDGQVIRELNKADTVFNAIVTGLGIRPRPLQPGNQPNRDYTPADVWHLSEATGGEAIKADEGVSFPEMIEHIRTRYTLAYPEPQAEPGTFRHVQVSLTAMARRRYPAAEVKVRDGYYAQ